MTPEIDKLEKKRQALAAELAGMDAGIATRTEALAGDLLADRDITKGTADLRAAESRAAVLRSAIAQADTRLQELRQAEHARQQAEAAAQAAEIDENAAPVFMRFCAGVLQAERQAEELDTMYKQALDICNDANVTPVLTMTAYMRQVMSDRPERRLAIKRLRQYYPDLVRQAEELQ